jgi:hypothetical protein
MNNFLDFIFDNKKNKHIITISLIISFILVWFLFPKNVFNKLEIGLDPSWQIAIQLAFKNNLVFGKDILFTYGPLGFIITRLPIGVSSFFIVLADLILLVGLFYSFYYIIKNNFNIFTLVLLGFSIYFLNYIFTYDLIMVWLWLQIFFLCLSIKNNNLIFLIISGVLAIIVFLMKLNAGIISLSFVLFVLLYFIILKSIEIKKIIVVAISFLLLLIISSIFFNINIINYFLVGLNIASTYNEAMNLPEKIFNVLEYPHETLNASLIIVACLIAYSLISIIYIARNSLKSKLMVLLVLFFISLSCFVLFKQSFVRADKYHIFCFAQFVTFFSLLLIIFIPLKKRQISLVFFTFIVFYAYKIKNTYAINNDIPTAWEKSKSSRLNYFKEIFHEKNNDNFYSENTVYFDYLKKHIKTDNVDIIPGEFSILYANNFNINFRPGLQSYASYNGFLDSSNYNKYKSNTAPKYVLFNLGSVDNRFPFSDDSKLKLALLEKYEIVAPEMDAFNDTLYNMFYPDVSATCDKENITPLQHYLKYGKQQARFTNFIDFYLNDACYLKNNPDVSNLIDGKVFINAKDHYKKRGFFENRLTSEIPILFKEKQSSKTIKQIAIKDTTCKFGQWVNIPYEVGPIYLYTKIDYTLKGSLLKTIYQPNYLRITVKLDNQQEFSYRLIPSIFNAGVLINKRVFSNYDAFLYFKKMGSFNQNIIAFKIEEISNIDNSIKIVDSESYKKLVTLSFKKLILE